jgi:Tfp pilus assembly protein PilO
MGLFFLGSDIGSRAEKISRFRQEVNSRVALNESLALLNRDYEQAKKYLPELENAFPTRDELVNLSRDLGIIANQNKVNLSTSLGSETREPNSKLSRVSVSLNAQGTLDNIVKFLNGLKTSRYFVKIDGFDLTRQANENFKISLTGVVLSF